MKTIRQNTFETNSSSTHSLSLVVKEPNSDYSNIFVETKDGYDIIDVELFREKQDIGYYDWNVSTDDTHMKFAILFISLVNACKFKKVYLFGNSKKTIKNTVKKIQSFYDCMVEKTKIKNINPLSFYIDGNSEESFIVSTLDGYQYIMEWFENMDKKEFKKYLDVVFSDNTILKYEYIDG